MDTKNELVESQLESGHHVEISFSATCRDWHLRQWAYYRIGKKFPTITLGLSNSQKKSAITILFFHPHLSTFPNLCIPSFFGGGGVSGS